MLNKKIVFTAFLLCFSCCSVVFANSQVRIGVMQFLSRTDEVSESQAVAVTDMITRILHSSPSIAVIERERLRVIAMEQGLIVPSILEAPMQLVCQLRQAGTIDLMENVVPSPYALLTRT